MRTFSSPSRWDVYVELDGELFYRWAGQVTEVAAAEYAAELRTGETIGAYKSIRAARAAVVRAFTKHVGATR